MSDIARDPIPIDTQDTQQISSAVKSVADETPSVVPPVTAPLEDDDDDDDDLDPIEPEAHGECVAWLQDRIMHGLALDENDWKEKHTAAITQYILGDATKRAMFCYAIDDDDGREKNVFMDICHPHLAGSNISADVQNVMYFVKTDPNRDIIPENIDMLILCGVVHGSSMESFLRLMQFIFAPSLLRNRTWPDSIQKDFSTHMHEFLSDLTESANRMKGSTILYVPIENMTQAQLENAHNDTDLLQRFQLAITHWTKQIKDVISEKNSRERTSENEGPLAEIEFWRALTLNFTNIRQQLIREDVAQIVDVLQRAKSGYYLDPFLALKDEIEANTEEAIDNLKFLKVLQEPCERLSKAQPKEIKDIVREILRSVQMIFHFSKYYNTPDRLSNILRKVSVEIIHRCREKINLNLIFDGDVGLALQALTESMEAGEAWKNICRKMLEATEQRLRQQHSKQLEVDELSLSIFSDVNNFVLHRCSQLQQLCYGQMQFGFKQPKVAKREEPPAADGTVRSAASTLDFSGQLPVFGGTRGQEVEGALYDIQRTFKTKLDVLRTLGSGILDVKSMLWHDQFGAFRLEMENLGNMMTQIINNAFEVVTTVEQGVELIEAFHYLAKRDNITHTVMRKADDVIKSYFNLREVSFVMRESGHKQRINPTTYTIPARAGAAMWYRSLRQRLDHNYKLLDRLYYLKDVEEKQLADSHFNRLDKALESHIKDQYEQWKYNMPPSFQPFVEQNVIARRTDVSGVEVFEVNFPVELLVLFDEIRYWERLGDPIPAQAADIRQREERLRTFREHVSVAVRAYNSIVLSLKEEDRKLFADRIAFLESKYLPGVNKHTWSSQGLVEYFVRDCKKHSAELQEIVNTFKQHYKSIKHHCKVISETLLISIERKVCYKVDDFDQRQKDHLERVKTKLKKAHSIIINSVKTIFDFTRNDYLVNKDIQDQWAIFVANVETDVDESLRSMLKRSFQELGRAIGDGKEEKQGENQLFWLEIVLEGSRPEPKPSIIQLHTIMSNLNKDLLNVSRVIDKVVDALLVVINDEPDTPSEQKAQIKDLMTDGAGVSSDSYYDSVTHDRELRDAMKLVTDGMSTIQEKVHEHIRYKCEQPNAKSKPLREVYQFDKDAFMRRFAKGNKLAEYNKNINDYRELDKNIGLWENTHNCLFVRMDYTPLKASLKQHCQQWQQKFLQLLNTIAKKELDDLYEAFRNNIDTLSKPLASLHELGDQIASLNKVVDGLEEMETSFEPLMQRYAMLESFQYSVPEAEQDRRAKLPQEFEKFKKDLDECKKVIDKEKERFREELEIDIKSFEKSSDQLKREFQEKGPFEAAMTTTDAFRVLNEYRTKLVQKREKESQLRAGMAIFEIERGQYTDLRDLQNELQTIENIWKITDSWRKTLEMWQSSPFNTLDMDDMNDNIENFRRDVGKMKKELEKKNVWSQLSKDMDTYRKTVPVLGDLRNKAMRGRHWRILMDNIGQEFEYNSSEFTLKDINELHLEAHAEFIQNLSNTASQELNIENGLAKIKTTWEATDFPMESFGTRHTYYRIGNVEDIQQDLEDHIRALGTHKMSRFIGAFQTEVVFWEQTLSIISDTLDALLNVQTKWMYLENIFIGSEDIKKRLHEEAKLFDSINSQWGNIMSKINTDRNVMRGTKRDGLLDQLNRMAKDLEDIQRSLDDFLNDKRKLFPRFYFLSNDDLLEILGHSRDPEKVQPHLRKCFEGIYKLRFEPDGRKKTTYAKCMIAADGEEVPFCRPVEVEGQSVESWLQRVTERMRDTITIDLCTVFDELVKKVFPSLKIPSKKELLENWVTNHKGMYIITAAQLSWTYETAKAIRDFANMGAPPGKKSNPVYRLYRKWKTLLKRYTEMIRGQLSKLTRLKLVALITIEVHSRDILYQLQGAKVQSEHDFDWTKQLRFEFEKMPDSEQRMCMIKQTSAMVPYDYEYLGNSGRLVVTPLTDRAYMTLTTALQLYLGGLPQGPAGTGKTETVKDLGKAIGKYVMVFNCSDGLDYKSLGRMFSGLAQTGSWSCFDEFNRIEVEVLSVVAQQIFAILNAVKLRLTRFSFEGDEIELNLRCGIFVTMNPGYAGRSELPDNLKALLRPISMMVPDFTLICEITLLSQGFQESKELSLKVAILYELMEKQLSKQDHYDFSLRNIKAVLVQAGFLKRERFVGTESQLCLKACSDMNLPKFVKDDVPIFVNILRDLFPGVELDDPGLVEMRKRVATDLEAHHLQQHHFIFEKVFHLWDTLNTRHGVMCVGQTGSGKTTTWQTLSNALRRLKDDNVEGYERVRVELLNPKALSMDELYGKFFVATNTWKDGILSEMMRSLCRDESLTLKWLLFDGPVDTLWIESMNTVLDDNKMLTLTSGERINLTPQVSLVFEVQDLAVASPATVSRCGMVYFDVKDLGWEPMVKTWLHSRREYEQAINAPKPEVTMKELSDLFDQYVGKALAFRKRECVELFTTTEIGSVRSLCSLIDAIGNPDAEAPVPGGTQFTTQDVENYINHIKMVFAFALTWSIGASLTEEARRKFDSMIREVDGSFPNTDSAYEYFPDYRSHSWKHWDDHSELQRPYQPAEDTPYYRLLVPTVDTVRYAFIVGQLVRSRKHLVMTGNTGTGKSIIATQVVRNLPAERFMYVMMNFSAQTSSKNVQDIIEYRMDKVSKKSYSPPGGRRMVIFVEDLNMPQKDLFGSQPPLELLRLLMDNGYWFDRTTQARRSINDTQLMCNMTFGRPPISNRFLSKMNMINITFPSETVITKIFMTIMNLKFGNTALFSGMAETLVKSTLQVYARVTTDLLPIPSKSHYTFNLRDLSKVFQGIYGADLESMDSREHAYVLWLHECARVFSDRMNDPDDRKWFRDLLADKVAVNFQTKVSQLPSALIKEGKNPIFIDFWEGDIYNAKYKAAPSFGELKKKLEETLENFNSEPGARAMNLVFFSDAMEHMCRIHRIIRQPQGNAFLVGLGGSGRFSLTRLAAYIAQYQVFTIEVTRKYDSDRFHEDLKTLYKSCGVKKQSRVFYFTDLQIAEAAFLEDINNMLSTGEVPGLFPNDEMATIRDEIRRDAMEAKVPDTPDDLYAFFIERVRRNLHLVIAFSPAGRDFRLRLRMFPSLVSCTWIDWFSEWPIEALKEVALKFLSEVDVGPTERREPLADVIVHVHDTTNRASVRMKEEIKRYNYVTPTNYLEFVRGYSTLLDRKRDELGEQRDKLRNGLDKLEDTKVQVGKMSADLKVKEEALKQKSAEVEDAMRQIQNQQQIADEQKTTLDGEKVKIERDKQQTEAIASEAKQELDKAMPALDEATSALNSLEKGDINEMKSYSRPPDIVVLVMQAVHTVLKRPPSWEEAKKSLTDPQFLNILLEFDKNSMSDALLQRIERFIKNPTFQPHTVQNVSKAAGGLCKWVIAIHRYGLVFKEVYPKQLKLKSYQDRLAQQEAMLKAKQDKLNEILERVKKLQDDLQANLDEKTNLQKTAAETEAKLKRAQQIVNGLEGERDRWLSSIAHYETSIDNLVGDALLGSGFLSYTGAFTANYRHELLVSWSQAVRKAQIPNTRNFNFVDFLVDAIEVRDWQSDGLPGDEFSTENGVVVTRGTRWPLMIDPQGQANKWIKKMEKDKNLRVIDPKQPDFIRAFEQAVPSGTPVLLQDILEDIDPSLDSIVSRAVTKKGARMFIKIGDSEYDFHPNFKLYITTKMPNPHYTPETCTKVALINFSVKEKGLEEQLLKIVVEKEKPELEEENEKNIKSYAFAKKETKRLEDEILDLLAKSDESLLDNVKLIDTLAVSKQTAIAIEKQLKEADAMSERIFAAREQYRESAKRASILYFVLMDLGAIDNMYQFAMDAYIQLFQMSITQSAEKHRSESVQARVSFLNEWHTGSVYRNTCRGLFEKHKLLFSFHMTMKILMDRGEILTEEYAFFLKGGIVLDKESQTPNPCPWLSERSWDNISELDKLMNFHGIVISFEQIPHEWKLWYLQEKPEECPLPGDWQVKVQDNYLHRMIIVRCMRPDRIMFMVKKYISDMLSAEYVDPPAFNLQEVLHDSRANIPLIFVLSPGVDPRNQLENLAQKQSPPRNLKVLALGQGQGPLAMKAVNAGTQHGGWVFLANCHLMVSWLADLEKIIDGLSNSRIDDNFRLWLSSIPTQSFPIGILQKSLKMTTEPPNGLKANMQRLYDQVREEDFNEIQDYPKLYYYRPLLYGLCFFHSVLLERKKFGTLGYNVIYDFNFSDFDVSHSILRRYIQEMSRDAKPDEIPWTTIRYLVAEATYGGRVTDAWDRKTLNTYMEAFLNINACTQESYKLSSDENYAIPGVDLSLQMYRERVRDIPLNDAPEAFGQHPNADISSQIQNSTMLLDALMSMSASIVKTAGASGDNQKVQTVEDRALAILSSLEEVIPNAIDYDAVVEANLEDKDGAVITCLLQEIQRYNILLAKLHRQKLELRKAVKGESLMNDELDSIFNAILLGKVPMAWQSAYPSVKPLSSWARDLVLRVDQLIQWGRSTPKMFWLSGLTYPTGFLKALQQEQARKYQIPIDQYGWEFTVLPAGDRTITHAPKEGAYIRGIHLEGAGWEGTEKHCLVEPQPMQLAQEMPLIHFKPKVREGKTKYKGLYICPLYMYPVRTGSRERPSFVVSVDLPSGPYEPEHWIKRGTALLLSTDE